MNNFYTNVHQSGNFIYVRETGGDKYKVEYNPTLYIPSNEDTGVYSLDGVSVEPMKMGSIREAREFIKQYDGVDNFQVFGQTQWQYAWISDTYHGDIECDISRISITNIDIEVASVDGFPDIETADQPVITITMKDFGAPTYQVFHYRDDFDENSWKEEYPERDVEFFNCSSEEDLLNQFLAQWKRKYPDVVTGWNVRLFDFPYLIQRIINLFGEKKAKQLSPWGMLNETTVSWLGKDQKAYDIIGVNLLDYMALYKKFVNDPRESYRLDYIAELELGVGKKKYSGSIQQFYENNFDEFLEYNIIDVELVERLEKKMKLIELVVNVAYESKTNYIDVMSMVRLWDVKIYNALRDKNTVVPFKETHEKSGAYEGAYVKEPRPGLYEWVVSFDVTSLYPSIIRVLNIGIETKVAKINEIDAEAVLSKAQPWQDGLTKAKENSWCFSANGVYYSKKRKSFYSELIETMFANRLKFKKLAKQAKDELEHCHDETQKAKLVNDVAKYDLKQKSVKIAMNSLYGAIGNEYFRYFDIDNAEAVTLTGQVIIRHIERECDKYMNQVMGTKDVPYVVYCDTDSVYIRLDDLVNKCFKDTKDTVKVINFLDKVCKTDIQPFIDKVCHELSFDMLNGMGDLIKMIRDVLTNKAIWTAKKRYIMNVYDSEGLRYEKPKLKLMGIEAVKSSTPKACRENIKEAINLIINKDNDALIDFIEEFREKFDKLNIEDIAFPRGVNGIEKYTMANGKPAKGTPYHVKGAILHNWLIEQKKLQNTVSVIRDSEKIKFIALRVPNPVGDKVISFIGELPKEFGMDKFIDYDEQFQKSFLDPLSLILNAIGWTTERRLGLSEFFV
jgi:DNA polymerase elongation subunit (family B)